MNGPRKQYVIDVVGYDDEICCQMMLMLTCARINSPGAPTKRFDRTNNICVTRKRYTDNRNEVLYTVKPIQSGETALTLFFFSRFYVNLI